MLLRKQTRQQMIQKIKIFFKTERGDVAVYGIPGIHGLRYMPTPGTSSLRTRHRHPNTKQLVHYCHVDVLDY